MYLGSQKTIFCAVSTRGKLNPPVPQPISLTSHIHPNKARHSWMPLQDLVMCFCHRQITVCYKGTVSACEKLNASLVPAFLASWWCQQGCSYSHLNPHFPILYNMYNRTNFWLPLKPQRGRSIFAIFRKSQLDYNSKLQPKRLKICALVSEFYSGQDRHTHTQPETVSNPRLAQSELWPTMTVK